MPAPEIDVIARNAETFPSLAVWGWEIPVYLFLGGLSAGLLVLSGLAWRRTERSSNAYEFWGPVLAPLVLAVGMGALFLDLEHKLHVWRFYTTFQWRSPMSWGSWILLLVFPASGLMAWMALTGSLEDFRTWVANVNIAAGTALGIYTGILLGAIGARPLWNTPLLGPLFLASGLSAAAALLHLLEDTNEERQRLAGLDRKFMLVEAGLLALILLTLYTGGAAQRSAARLLLGGGYTAVFWVGVVFAGMVLPLLLERWQRQGKAQVTLWAPILVLAGGLALRAVFVMAGQASHWEYL